MERLLLKIYRKYTPKWLKRDMTDQTKDWLLGLLIYVASRPNLETLRLRGRANAAMRRGDWRTAVEQWQILNMQSRSFALGEGGVTPDAEEVARKSAYSRNQLRTARMKLAFSLYENGEKREFRELVGRVVEAIPDHRVMKKDNQIIKLIRTYVTDALREDEDDQDRSVAVPVSSAPLKIAICLDVLKVSDVHTHSRVVFAMCRNLMTVHPDVETHLIVTNERFVTTAAVVAHAFHPLRHERVIKLAQEAFGEDFGKQFFLHSFQSNGLEGVVDTCKSITEINPDVILYGGGHRGLFSNESRVIRHCLFEYFPSAFFFIQANNHVDQKLDMIIARGPHQILGQYDNVKVNIQPYPTINEKVFTDDTPIDITKHERKVIVSAIAGVRMNIRMAEMSDSDLKTMFGILDQVPGSVWHLVGAADPEELIAANPLITRRVESGQIKVHGLLPFDAFSAVMAQATIFLHMPGFTGGSGGASVARRLGIPILTFEHSDVSGRQPPQTIFDERDLKGWASMACTLLSDAEKWLAIVEQQRAHTDWIRRTSAQAFYDCLIEAVEIGQKRISAEPQDGSATPKLDRVASPQET